MASEDVINPFALACFFEDDDVLGLLDNTYTAFIPAGIGANWAGFSFGKVEAGFALLDFGFDVAYGLGEGKGIGGFGFEDMEGQPFGGLRADTRKASQFLNQFINGFSIASRHNNLTNKYQRRDFIMKTQRRKVIYDCRKAALGYLCGRGSKEPFC